RNTSEVAPDPRYSAPKRPAPTKSIKRTSTQKEPTLSWCHQCRRNTLHDKMKCTNIRPDGDVCPYRFCILCIKKREAVRFSLFHPYSFVYIVQDIWTLFL